MNRYEANRIAKEIYCTVGEYYLNMGDETWEGYATDEGWSEKESKMIFDYYERTAGRVRDWLRL